MSNSRVYFDRFVARDRWRKAVATVYFALTLIYLGWRFTILNDEALTLSVVYYVAEVFGFVLALTLIFCSWNYRHREPLPAPRGLKVDVFIPVYKEPASLIRWTITAAKRISYPHQTLLLDDGNRPELQALARELGVRYLARERNIDAKAGNLNNGLAHSDADYVMVLDADHIALPHALDATLGFFCDQRVAMVQTPQDYYNTDAFQFINARSGALWHDQSFFYGIAQASRDSYNGASCVGTGVIYRRSALDAIGGVPTETVTEDFHTSLRLHKAGHEVVYLNEPVAYGVAAADIRDYYKTRHRWAHGNLHALRIERVLSSRSLSLGQKLSYLTLGLIYLEGWQQMLLFIVPLVSLVMGWPPFTITVFNVLLVLLFPVLTTLLLQELGCGMSRFWVNEIFAVARFPTHIVASLALVSDKMRFRTSTKNVRGRVEWLLLSPQLLVGAASLAALAVATVRLSLDFRVGPLGMDLLDLLRGRVASIVWSARLDQGFTVELVVVSGFWALFNAAKCFYLVRKAVRDAERSNDDYRFAVRLPMEVEVDGGRVLARIERLSSSWATARWYGGNVPAVGQTLRGRLYLPSGPLPVQLSVTARHPPVVWRLGLGPIVLEVSRAKKLGSVDCHLIWAHEQHRRSLAECLYSVDWHREFMHRHAFFSTPLEALRRCVSFGGRAAEDLSWSPALYRLPATGQFACAIVGTAAGASEGRMIAFHTLDPDREITLYTLGRHDIVSRRARIGTTDSLRSLAGKGLDGSSVHKYRIRLHSVGEATVQAQAIAVAAE